MFSDDSAFQQIYESLPPGLVVAACTSKSIGMMLFSDEDILTSFCRSLKGAAIRCGSNAMHFWWGYSQKNWKTKGIEHFRSFIEKHNAAGVRLFLVNRGSIGQNIGALIQEACLAKNVTAIVTTIAENVRRGKFNEDSLATKDRKDVHFHRGTAFILLEHYRQDDDWFSASVYIGEGDKHYGPLHFVSECPQPPGLSPEPNVDSPGDLVFASESQPPRLIPEANAESPVDPIKPVPLDRPKRRFLDRILAALGF